jgi:hypothetical protein
MGKRNGDWENLTPQQKADAFDAQIAMAEAISKRKQAEREAEIEAMRAAGTLHPKGKHRK